MKRSIWLVVLIIGLMLAGTASGQYDVYKNGVPDVDKIPGTPAPDNTCWINSAANVLGAAGWGTGVYPQARGDDIRNDLTAHFGTMNPGWSSVAINWWLLNHGLNSDSPQYNPDLATTYTDVTIMNGRLTDADYDWLLDELVRCQYVNVSFEIPYSETGIGHEMTLVGGNYSPSYVPPGAMPPVSVWHDGDVIGGPADTIYENRWVGVGPAFWSLDTQTPPTPQNPNDDWEANGATLLCPGLTKPYYAMENFDYAWFKDMDVNTGNLVNSSRLSGTEAGVYAFGPNAPAALAGSVDPVWDQDPDVYELYVPNEEKEDTWHKELWLLVDYIDRNPIANPGVLIEDPAGNQFNPTDVTWSDDGGQVLLHWILDDQPDWEKIIFPNASYRELYDISSGAGGTVKDWNLATYCFSDLPGDVNNDGYVGGLDLTTIITNWGVNPADRLQGDLSGDGTVAGADYTEVITYWGTGVPPPPEPGSIPEPATMALMLMGGLALVRRR